MFKAWLVGKPLINFRMVFKTKGCILLLGFNIGSDTLNMFYLFLKILCRPFAIRENVYKVVNGQNKKFETYLIVSNGNGSGRIYLG